MKTQTKGPRFRATFTIKGDTKEAAIHTIEGYAVQDARDAVKRGATFAAILRDSGGTDHPDNAGKFFLHRYIKA